jgi:hypothetical protein
MHGNAALSSAPTSSSAVFSAVTVVVEQPGERVPPGGFGLVELGSGAAVGAHQVVEPVPAGRR